MIKLYKYDYDSGRLSVYCKEGSCLICSHCTDVLWDYTNGPYMAFCELDLEMETCNHFKLQEGYKHG